MKSQYKIFNSGFAAFFLPLLALLACGAHYLDSNREKGSRTAYEQFLKEAAKPFENRKIPKKGEQAEMDSPELASLQEFFMTMDPSEKRVTAERLSSAYTELLTLRGNQIKSNGYQLQWTGTDCEMGGRTRAIMWDPLVNNKVWAGSVTGGLWYNNDITSALSEWKPVSDLWDNLVISSITFDPNDSLTMYVGTGEVQTALLTYRESGGRGVGIWKTNDGGESWTLIPSTSQFAYVSKIVVRNESGNSVLYAGVASGLYHGTQQSQPSDGLYRSADDGQSWQQVLPNIPGYSVPYCVNDVVLGADGRIYIGTMQNIDGIGGDVLLYSDNGTPGSWNIFNDIATLIQPGSYYPLRGRVVIAAAPSDANVVYAAFAAGRVVPGDKLYYFGKYLYRSNDKGATWNPVNLPGGSEDWANLAWHAMVLGVDPNNPEIIYAGGLDQWRSTNGGSTWKSVSDWTLMYYGGGVKYIHGDQHVVAYKPGVEPKVLFGTDGGVFYSADGNAANPVFLQRNRNFNTLQFYTGALHPGAGYNVFMGGLQDNGTLLFQGSSLSIYNMISGGDGAYCFWDKDTPSFHISSVYYNRYYVFNNNSNVNNPGIYSGVFINPADYYSEENTLFANATDYWNVRADSLLIIDNLPTNTSEYFIKAGTGSEVYFSHVKVSPFSAGYTVNLFLGTVSGKLFKLSDALIDPVSTEIGSPAFPAANISSVSVGGSEDTLLVTFSNYGVSSIWQTYNGGQSWQEVEGNLPDMPVRWAIYHPQNSRQAMIATELGVWTTSNLGDASVIWAPQNAGMANVRVDMLTMRNSDNTVLAASHGRGLFTCTFNLDLNTSVSEFSETKNPFTIFASSTGIQMQSSENQLCEYDIYSISGSKVLSGSFEGRNKNRTVTTSELTHGVYVVRMQSAKHKLVKKVVF